MSSTMDTIELVERSIAFIQGSGITSAQLTELQTGYTFTKTPSQPTALTASTTSRVTWVDAMYYSLVLPSGTWTVEVQGSVELVNTDKGPQADARIVIAGNGGSTFARTVGGPTPIRVARPSHTRTGQTGTIGIRLQYKKSTGAVGTLRAYAPSLVIACKRTS